MRILGIGDNTVDIYVDRGIQYPGGNAVNVAVISSRLGAKGSYLGCIGNDERGRLIETSLLNEGVDISNIRRLEEKNAWSRIRHIRNERVFDKSHRIPGEKYKLKSDDYSYIKQHDLCHSSIYSDLDAELANIKESAKCFSFDFSDEYTDEYICQVTPHIDIAFLSAADLDEDGVNALIRKVASYGCQKVIVTRGELGSLGYDHGDFVEQQALKAEIVDTLGAGDGFISGYLTATLMGKSLSEALLNGAKHAAQICSEQGAFGYGIPYSES